MATIKEQLDSLGKAIRNKTGKTELLSLQEMAQELNNIPEKSYQDLAFSGPTVIVPAGNYKEQISKEIPSFELSNPTVQVDSNGRITTSVIQQEGYVIADEQSDYATKTTTYQLPVQEEQIIIPGTSDKEIAAGVFLAGKQIVKGDANLIPNNIVSGKTIFDVVGNFDVNEAALNFTVIGGLMQPDIPIENTVWINTDVDITSWFFSLNNPYIAYKDVELTEGLSYGLGYITNTGSISSQTASNPELYTQDYIPVKYGTAYNYEYTVSATKSMWLAIVEYTGNYTFKTRKVVVDSVSGTRQTGTYTPSSSDVTAVRLTGRTFPNTTATISFIEPDVEYTIGEVDEGTVWITTGTSSAIAFNALKKNGIEVYPTFVKQFVNGIWVNVEAKIYQDGKWVAFKTNILLEMVFNQTYSHGSKVSFHSPTAEEPYLTVSTTYSNSSAQGKLIICTDKTYDLTGVNTIEFVVDEWTLGSTSYPLRLFVCSALPTTLTPTMDASITITQSITEPTTLLLDVSSLSDSFYIAVKSEGSTTEPKTTGGTISGIYLV